MDETASALLTLTREIGGLTEAVKGQGREIGELKGVLEKRANACTVCRTEIDREIDGVKSALAPIQEKHTGEDAVRVFLSSTLGQVSVAVGILSGSAALVVQFVLPVVLKVIN